MNNKNFLKLYAKKNKAPKLKVKLPSEKVFGDHIRKYISLTQKDSSIKEETNKISNSQNTSLDFNVFFAKALLDDKIFFHHNVLGLLIESLESMVEFLYEESLGLKTSDMKIPFVSNKLIEISEKEAFEFFSVEIEVNELPSDYIFHKESLNLEENVKLVYYDEKKGVVHLDENFYKDKVEWFRPLFEKFKDEIEKYKKLENFQNQINVFERKIASDEDDKLEMVNGQGNTLSKKTIKNIANPIQKEIKKYNKTLTDIKAKIIKDNNKIFKDIEIQNFRRMVEVFSAFEKAKNKIEDLFLQKNELEKFLEDQNTADFYLQSIRGLSELSNNDEDTFIDIKNLEKYASGFSEFFEKEVKNYKQKFDENYNSEIQKIIQNEVINPLLKENKNK